MASFNKVILMGNLTRDPELRQSQSGTSVAKAGLAVNESAPDGAGGWSDKAHFFDFTVFGKRAESFAKHFNKGKPILIEGRLDYSTWEDKETGQKRNKVSVVVFNWEFVGGREDQGGGSGGDGSYQSAGGSPPAFPAKEDFKSGGGGFPDDVPF